MFDILCIVLDTLLPLEAGMVWRVHTLTVPARRGPETACHYHEHLPGVRLAQKCTCFWCLEAYAYQRTQTHCMSKVAFIDKEALGTESADMNSVQEAVNALTHMYMYTHIQIYIGNHSPWLSRGSRNPAPKKQFAFVRGNKFA